jgi:rhodanese-related sulfurtransferase
MIKHKTLRSCCSILLAAFLVACNSETETTLSTGIDVKAAKQMILDDKNVVVLDVRTPKEFAKGHIAGAVNINIHDPAFPQHVSTLDRDKTYIVHCAVNPRSGRGDKSIHIMTELGFPDLLSMDGGLNAWKRAGLPIHNS